MEKRFDPRADFAPGYEAMSKLAMAVKASGLDPALVELVEVRVSQINGCAYCLSVHVPAARKAGVSQRKLDLLPAWRESGAFDARESAALAWAEALTRVADAGMPEDLHARMRAVFDAGEIAALGYAVVLINGWNRLMVAAAVPPAPAATP
ncbi:MAG: carboxymuconolactone decarboxylase family protein [Magnetospirillum sp.]|nr:carboxymuconolactone decarboxylase family protein [Magnetospirillum sp.]